MDMPEGLMAKGVDFVSRQRRPFKVNIAKNVVMNFSLSLTYQYQSLYITALGASALQLGLIGSIGGLASMLVTIPVGFMADKHGIRRILLIFIPTMAIGYAIFGLAWTWQVTALAMFITTMSWDGSFVVCPMICGRCLSNAERTTGMQLCDTLAAIPRLVAPVAAAFLITYFGGLNAEGIRPLYWIEVVGLLISFLIIWRYFEDPPLANPSEHQGFVNGFRRILDEGVAVKRWIVYMLVSMFPMYMAIYIPLYARNVKGADQFVLGFMDTAYWVVIVLLAIPVGVVADRIGKKRLVMLLTPLYCVGVLLMMFSTNNVTLVAASLLTGFFMLAGVTQGAISVELVPQELLGSWFGLSGFFRGIVSMVSPILGGMLWNTYGPDSILVFLAASQILKLGILYTIPKR